MPYKMFIKQNRIREAILYVIMVDILLGYMLKTIHPAPGITLPIVLLYILNISVIFGVYRFWKLPVFQWGDDGFILFGVSPFKREVCSWDSVEMAGFKEIEVKKGKPREQFLVVYTDNTGKRKTGVVPMDWMDYRDGVKKDMLAFLRKKKVKPV